MSCQGVGGTSRVGTCDANGHEQGSRIAPSGELLPGPFAELASTQDIGAQIAALIVSVAREQKESARATRAVAERAQQAADENELACMKEQADAKLAAGMLEGGTKVVSGAIGIGSAGCSSKAAAAAWKGVAEGTAGAGKVLSTLKNHDADMAALAEKKWGQIAGREGRAVGDASDLEKDAKEMLDRALSYYKEYLTAKSDTQRATLLRA